MTGLPKRVTPKEWKYSETDFAIRPDAAFSRREDFDGAWAVTDTPHSKLWSSTAGGGTSAAAATTVANSVNGEVTIKSASDDTHNGFNTSRLTGINLSYKANKGGLFMEARLKLDVVSAVALFVGFSDAISTTYELPLYKTDGADTVDSDADDACGVVFDTDGVTDQFFHCGVKATVDTDPVHGGSSMVPVADTYFVVRVEVSTAGAVRGYIDGVPLGDWLPNAVTPTVALTPWIAISNRSAAQRIATVDYIRVGQNR